MPAGMKDEHVEASTPLDAARAIAGLDPVDATTARATALVFRTLGSPLRVQIVAYLHQRGPTSRAQLASALSQTWSLMAHHLTAPVRDGFVTADGEGITCKYELADDLLPRIQALCAMPDDP